MKFTRWFAIFLSFVFGCGIVGVSLVNAATVFPVESSSPSPSALPLVPQSSEILPGQIWYPAVVASQKIQLYLMDEQARCQQRVQLATERWQSARTLVEMGYTDLAVSTFLKAHQYLAEATQHIQNSSVEDPLRVEIIEKLHAYRKEVETTKDKFADHQKVLLDQTLAENEALLIHLGTRP